MRSWLLMAALGLAVALGTVSGSPGADAASTEPVSGAIAFFSARGPGGDNEIYSMNPDGTEVRNLTQNPADDRDAAWSADGGAVAFSTNRGSGGNYEIFVMSWDGTNQHNVTNSAEDERDPYWNGYTGEIYFVREIGASGEIFVMNPDGSNQVNLTNNPADDRDPARGFGRGFAGDGVLFATNRGSDGNYEIFEMAPDGSGQTNLTNHPADDREPALRCSGLYQQDWIAFSSNRLNVNDVDHDIFLMSPDGTNVRRVTSGPSDDRHPFVKEPCPWGVRLVFSRRAPGGNAEVYSYEDGSVTDLTKDPADDLGPSVSYRPPAPPPPPGPPPPPPSVPPPPSQAQCVAPRVIGLTLRRARARIRARHCSVGRVRRARSARAGRVIGQNPKAGAVRRNGYPVKLVVGRR